MSAPRWLSQRVLASLVVVGLCLWSLAALAGEAFVLRLGTEGSATVVLSRESFTAFLTDGGRKSGLVGASIDGQTVAEMLKEAEIRHLVVTCSHPHDDHIGGLVKFLTSAEMTALRLTQVDFVESGFGDDSLHKVYEKYWKDKAERPPVSKPHTAEGKNAFGAITFERGTTVDVENLVYTAKGKAGAHGRSVVTMYALRNGKDVTRLVDFDDADTDVVKEFIDWVRADDNAHLKQRKPDVVIMPHHGTSLEATDVTGLFDEDIRPRDVIFTVNEENRYLHPHPQTVAYCLGKLTAEHVHFTAGSNNVVITEKGVQRAEGATPLSDFAKAIRPKLDRVDAKLLALREISTVRELTPEQQRYVDRHAPWLKSMYDVLRKFDDPEIGELPLPTTPNGPVLPPNIGNFPSLAEESRALDRVLTGETPQLPGAGGGGGPFAPRRTMQRAPRPPIVSAPPPRSGSGGGGGGVTRFRGGGARFQRMIRVAPVFGGVMLGNEFDSGDLKVESATIRIENDEDGLETPVIQVNVIGPGSKRQSAILDGTTATDLWCAMRFVDATDVNREFGLKLTNEDCGLVGITRNRLDHDAWFFGIHPAIANTRLAQDAMRLDMVLTARQPELLEGIRILNYQWFDEPAVIRCQAGQVVVSASTDPRQCLLRVRLWGPGKSYDDVAVEIARRVKGAAEKAVLTKEPAYIMAVWPLEEEALLQEAERREAAGEDTKDVDAKLDEDREGYYRRLKISDSAAVFLEQALEDTELTAVDGLDDEHFDLDKYLKSIERELLVLAKDDGPKDFESSIPFRLWKLYARLEFQEEDGVKLTEAVRESAKKAGLDETADFKIWEFRQHARTQVMAELMPRNIDFDVAKLVDELSSDFESLRRLDRFARVVSVLRWVKEDTGALPKIAEGARVVPIRMNVPPVFFFRDVWGDQSMPALNVDDANE